MRTAIKSSAVVSTVTQLTFRNTDAKLLCAQCECHYPTMLQNLLAKQTIEAYTLLNLVVVSEQPKATTTFGKDTK